MRFLLLLASFVLLPTLGISATIYVPDDFPTIQQAVDSAVDLDKIIVRPSTYVESVLVKDKNIVLTSEQGPEVTIIDGNRDRIPLTVNGADSIGTVINGFTIRNGYGHNGGGIYCVSSTITIKNNIVCDNEAANDGGGCFFSDASGLEFENLKPLDRPVVGSPMRGDTAKAGIL